jgi:hypothetical protein
MLGDVSDVKYSINKKIAYTKFGNIGLQGKAIVWRLPVRWSVPTTRLQSAQTLQTRITNTPVALHRPLGYVTMTSQHGSQWVLVSALSGPVGTPLSV